MFKQQFTRSELVVFISKTKAFQAKVFQMKFFTIFKCKSEHRFFNLTNVVLGPLYTMQI